MVNIVTVRLAATYLIKFRRPLFLFACQFEKGVRKIKLGSPQVRPTTVMKENVTSRALESEQPPLATSSSTAVQLLNIDATNNTHRLDYNSIQYTG